MAVDFSCNSAFVDVVNQARRRLGRLDLPKLSIAIEPRRGEFLVKLIDLGSGDPRFIKIKQEERVSSQDNIPKAVLRLLGKDEVDAICCLYMPADLGSQHRLQWTWINPISCQPVEAGGSIINSEFSPV